MLRVYGCINGHQLVPLKPSGFVNTLGKGFGRSLFMHYVVLELGFHVASAQLAQGRRPPFICRYSNHQTLCKCIVSLFSTWHGHASDTIVDLIAGENEGTLGFSQSYAFDLGLLLHGHGKPTSKILIASSLSGHF